MKLSLVPEAKLWHKLWSVRLAILFSGLIGFIGCWNAFESVVPPWVYVSIGTIGPMVIMAARLIDQKLGDQLKDAGQ